MNDLSSMLLKYFGLFYYFIRLAVPAPPARVEPHDFYRVILRELSRLIRHCREAVPPRAPFAVFIAAYNRYFRHWLSPLNNLLTPS
jgi:hypothetical protein